jgi:hypothetical protein
LSYVSCAEKSLQLVCFIIRGLASIWGSEYVLAATFGIAVKKDRRL